MKKVTLNIEESKYSFFLELIKNLDFVTIETHTKKDFPSDEIKKRIPDNQNLNTFSEEKKEDWFENLSISNKKNIQKGIDDLEKGKKHSHEDVTAFAKKKNH